MFHECLVDPFMWIPTLANMTTFCAKLQKYNFCKMQLFENPLGEAFQWLQPTPNLVGNHWRFV